MAELQAEFARYRLVDALERHWTITFRCQYCGTSKTWHRDTFLGRALPFLNATMTEIQRKVVCPRCPGHMPIMTFSGVLDPGAEADRLRNEVITTLLNAGLQPRDYGLAWPSSR